MGVYISSLDKWIIIFSSNLTVIRPSLARNNKSQCDNFDINYKYILEGFQKK